MAVELPFSQACENNKRFILAILHRHLGAARNGSILEIGSGTGQHAEFFAAALPALNWLASDLRENLAGLNRRIEAAELENLPAALELDVTSERWPLERVDHVFSANSLHIMPASSVECFFAGVGQRLQQGGLLFVYGPFKYGGQFTTPSNEAFDGWLKARDPRSGVRDFETVNGLARQADLALLEDNPMPANNQMLVWRKTAS